MKFRIGKWFAGIVIDTPQRWQHHGPQMFLGVGSMKAARRSVGA